MAIIFISHSSKDHQAAAQLAEDLRNLGHSPWLDAWEIKVGQCIPTAIESALEQADYVVVILTEESVKSGWVDREWKTKYWEEVSRGRTSVLPVLWRDCEIPKLLLTKRYADFRTNYSLGLVNLVAAIPEPLQSSSETIGSRARINPSTQSASAAIGKLQSRQASVAECISDILQLAVSIGNADIKSFCESELTGWPNITDSSDPLTVPQYRQIETFISFAGEINMNAFAWGGNVNTIWSYIRNNPHEFHPFKLFVAYPVSQIEAQMSERKPNSLLIVPIALGRLNPRAPNPNTILSAYARPDTYSHILESIRATATQKLVSLLPSIE